MQVRASELQLHDVLDWSEDKDGTGMLRQVEALDVHRSTGDVLVLTRLLDAARPDVLLPAYWVWLRPDYVLTVMSRGRAVPPISNEEGLTLQRPCRESKNNC